MATTALCASFKRELLMAGHCFAATMSSLAGAGTSAAFTITGLATTAGIQLGMAAGGTNVAAGAIVASIDSATAVTVSKAHTGTVTSGTISFTADVFKALLIKGSPVRTFDGTQTNVGTPGSSAASATNVGTDEATGTGYTSGGVTLGNIAPALSGVTATTQFTPDPSWTSATFTASAMVVYNSTARMGGALPLAGRTIGVYDFGGSQSVTAGTFTVLQPVNAAGTALIQIA